MNSIAQRALDRAREIPAATLIAPATVKPQLPELVITAPNVQRSAVVSRRDNNDMWAMAEKLEAIAKRISKKYP